MNDTRSAERPVLVLASGQRCGSTLVQRLLTSNPDIMIWGEHGGHLKDLLAMTQVLEAWDHGVSVPARDAFEKGAHQSWMANVLPGPDAVRDAARAYLLALFHEPAAVLGRPRWGFKEVRFGLEEAAAFRGLFGELRAIHITRDPRDVLVSLDWWERQRQWWRREFTEMAVRAWVTVNQSFLDQRDESWHVSVRYEDVVSDHGAFTERVAALLGVSPDTFDRSVFAKRIHDYGDGKRELRTWHDLPDDLRALLHDPTVHSVASAYGYELD